MKRHVIKTAKVELLIVEMPRAYDFDIRDGEIYIYDHESKEKESIGGSYSLVGEPDRISEEDAKELVKMGSYISTFWNYKTNDNHKSNQLRTAKESLLSLLESEIYWKNPLGIKEPIENFQSSTFGGEKTILYRNPMNVLWHEAEQKTFDKSRSLIFKKNN